MHEIAKSTGSAFAIGILLAAVAGMHGGRSTHAQVSSSGGITKSETLGPVEATVQLSPEKPVIGDTLELSLEVVADEGVELLMPEFGEALDRFAIIDFVPKERTNDKRQTIATQKYRLQSPLSGEHSIPPILIEFVDRRPGEKQSPDDSDAYELLLPRIDFTVTSIVADSTTDQLKPPLGELSETTDNNNRSWILPMVVVLVVFAVAGTFLKILSKRKSRIRRETAYEVARRRLSALLGRPEPTDTEIDAFFVELSDIVRHYLEDRFDMRAPELTTEEFLETVGDSPDLSEDHQRLLKEFLRQADLVKFAGAKPDSTTVKQSINAAERFIEETRDVAENPPANVPHTSERVA